MPWRSKWTSLAGFAAFAGAAALIAIDANGHPCAALITLGAVLLAGVLLLGTSPLPGQTHELLVGAATLGAALVAVGAAIVAIVRPGGWEVATALVASLLSLFLVATDWERRSLGWFGLLVGGLLVAAFVRVGYDEAHAARHRDHVQQLADTAVADAYVQHVASARAIGRRTASNAAVRDLAAMVADLHAGADRPPAALLEAADGVVSALEHAVTDDDAGRIATAIQAFDQAASSSANEVPDELRSALDAAASTVEAELRGGPDRNSVDRARRAACVATGMDVDPAAVQPCASVATARAAVRAIAAGGLPSAPVELGDPDLEQAVESLTTTPGEAACRALVATRAFSVATLDDVGCRLGPLDCEGPGCEGPAVDRYSFEVARYRAAVTGDDDDVAAATALADNGYGNGVTATMDAASQAPTALLALVTPGEADPGVPGVVGWVLIALVAVVLWVQLLKRNARQQPGPVQIESSTDEALGDYLHDFRIAVLQNVSEPGASPGSETFIPVTDLLDLAVPGVGKLTTFVNAVARLFARRYGYGVNAVLVSARTDVDATAVAPGPVTGAEPSAPTKASPAQVLVRVTDLRNGDTLATKLKEHVDDVEAVRAAGLWAAGFVLQRSTRTPHWTEWDAQTAASITSRERSLSELEDAVRAAPGSGLLLVQLGDRYELAGRPVDAVGVYARAVAAHPSYRLARYRLAACLGMLHTRPQDWMRLDPAKRAACLDDLGAAACAQHIDWTQRSRLDDRSGRQLLTERAVQKALRCTAVSWLRALEMDTRWWAIAGAALRRSDRSTLLPLLRAGRGEGHHRTKWLVKSARMAYSIDPAKLAEGTRAAREIEAAAKPRTWWQVSYNAACAWARLSHLTGNTTYAQSALRLLEQSLRREGAYQLQAGWVAVDPDLAPLRGDPRFTLFMSRLQTEATMPASIIQHDLDAAWPEVHRRVNDGLRVIAAALMIWGARLLRRNTVRWPRRRTTPSTVGDRRLADAPCRDRRVIEQRPAASDE